MSIPKQYNRRKFDRLHTNLQYISDQIPKVDFSNYNITENDCYEYLREIELARQKLKKKKDSWKNKITWISILFTCIMFILSVLGVFIMYPFFSIVKVLFPSFPIFAIILPFFIAIISGGGLHELLEKRISLFDTNCSFFPTINYEIENIFNDCLNNNKNIYNAPYLDEKKEIKENWKDEFGAKYNSDYKILIKVPSNLSSYTIIDGTEIIGERAFAVCINGLSTYSIWPNNSLKQVLLPNTIRKIEAWAFSRCKNIQTILLPNSLKEIGSYAFYNCSNLTSMIIPDSVNNIGNDAFYGCLSLSSVTIPNSVTEIGRGVFCYCTGLTSITIPNSVTNIGNSAFRSCWKLSSVTIPNSVTTIGERTFEDCTKLTSVTIPNSVKTIGDSAFNNCSGLISVTIPNSVTSIDKYAFSDCKSLESIAIPKNVIKIGEEAFTGCTGLRFIKVDANNSKYDSRNDCNAIIKTSSNVLISGCKRTIIPNNVTSIGNGAFSYCLELTSIDIPDSVTSIGDKAFYGCKSLTSIKIPNNVISIGIEAFAFCEKIESIYIQQDNIKIHSTAINGCKSLKKIMVPHGKKENFRQLFTYYSNIIYEENDDIC